MKAALCWSSDMNRIVASPSHSHTHVKSSLFNYRTRSTLLKREKSQASTAAAGNQIWLTAGQLNFHAACIFNKSSRNKETGAERATLGSIFQRRAPSTQKHQSIYFIFISPADEGTKNTSSERWRFFLPCAADGCVCVVRSLHCWSLEKERIAPAPSPYITSSADQKRKRWHHQRSADECFSLCHNPYIYDIFFSLPNHDRAHFFASLASKNRGDEILHQGPHQ